MADATRHIQVRQLGDIQIVTFNNLVHEVRDERSVREIGDAFYLLTEPGRPSRILLDFENAPFLPNAHFKGKLLTLRKRILKDGGFLMLANLDPVVKDCLRISRFDTIFSIHDSVEQAHEAFAGLALPVESESENTKHSAHDEDVGSNQGETLVPDSQGGARGVSAEPIRPDCTQLGHVVIIRPDCGVLGSWDGPDPLTPESLVLRDELQRIITETECDVVLDLSSLQGMRNFTATLLAAREAMALRGRRLALCLGSDLRQAFRSTQHDQVLPCFTSLDQAMAWLAEPDETEIS